MAALIFMEGPAEGRKFSLQGHNLVMVGRDASCSIQVIDSELSRNHMQIALDPGTGRHDAIDYNSRNGVYINGAKIEDRAPLADGDLIEIGASKVIYTTDDSMEAEHVRATSRHFGQGHILTQMPDGMEG